jgi:hypothetical protein
MTSSRHYILLIVALIASTVGCGASTGAKSKETSHARVVTALYFQAKSRLAKSPANAEEFKQAVAAGKPDWSKLGVSGLDELLVSERDGKPLAISYGPATLANGVVVYEQEGLNGIRLVGTSNGQVREADAAQFAKLVPKPLAP